MSQYGQIPDLTEWHDYGLGGDENYMMSREPEDWRRYGLPEFGAYSERMGIIDGCGMGLAAEVTPQIYGNRVLARTPILELTPRDYRWMRTMKKPYQGMRALGDDAAVYEWQENYDGLGGFFKRLFRGVKKVARRIGRGIKKVISKIPGGKFLIKLGKKIWKIAKKFVRPLTKFVGKYATKLAPVAAMIPGYGTAISAGLYKVGKVAKLMNKYAVKLTGKKGKVRKLKFKSGKKAKKFKKRLKKEARKLEKRVKRGPGMRRFKKMLRSGKKIRLRRRG
jgi:hypothetical protein